MKKIFVIIPIILLLICFCISFNTDFALADDDPGYEIETINDTYQSIGEIVDWFPIIIIFGAIVVLILLTVLIIRTVRTAGYGGAGVGSMGRDTA